MLLLASRSPRRADLLRAAGIAFERGPTPDVDESPPRRRAPGAIVEALAERKARAVAPAVPGRTVLTADTLVFLDGRILGKPRDATDATRMLAALSGRSHQVVTGLTLARADSTGAVRCLTRHHGARVRFRALSAAEIASYVATGEPLDKAGAYGIQGGASAFASCSPVDLDAVIGLPMALLRKMLDEWGALS